MRSVLTCRFGGLSQGGVAVLWMSRVWGRLAPGCTHGACWAMRLSCAGRAGAAVVGLRSPAAAGAEMSVTLARVFMPLPVLRPPHAVHTGLAPLAGSGAAEFPCYLQSTSVRSQSQTKAA